MSKVHKIWNIKQDRMYMKDVLYPAISKSVGNGNGNGNKSVKILDIGCNDYNAMNKKMFGMNNNTIDYWIIDKYENKPINCDCDHYEKISLEDFAKRSEMEQQFDVIISIGVLGCYTLSDDDIVTYLNSVKRLLRKDGIFILHMPTKRTAANKYSDRTWYPMRHIMPYVLKTFVLSDSLGIPSQYTTNDGSITFNVLKLI